MLLKKKFQFSAILTLITMTILVGCVQEHRYQGSGEHWKVKVVQNTTPEQFEIAIEYIGKEEELTSFAYQFLGDEFGASGTTQMNKEPPYIYGIKYSKIGQKEKLRADSIDVIIQWNNKEEKVTLKKY